MGLNRRNFLQKAGLGLAILGVSEIVPSLLGNNSRALPMLERYFQVLAQPGARKLALLVGINQYPGSTALTGCVTDVELQRELLIHRFGFKASDILTLTDSQASRENMETAFVEHLTEQAKAGDVVVFHFSGYGSSVKKSQESLTDSVTRSDSEERASAVARYEASEPGSFQNSLVPNDGIPTTKEADARSQSVPSGRLALSEASRRVYASLSVANALLEETLVLLLRSLATDHVTTVLDTSYISASSVLQGSLRVRSTPSPPADAPSPEELAFQAQIRLRPNSVGAKLFNSANPNQVPGVVLCAAGAGELAKEAQWHGFSAGLFTYALTQYLWQAAPATSIQISLSRTAGMVNQLVGREQQPTLSNPKSQNNPSLAYYLPPDSSIGADGVVMAVEENGKTAQVWLAGLPATVLEYYGLNSILSLEPSQTPLTETEQLETDSAQASNPKSSPDARRLATASLSPIPNPQPVQLQIRSKEGLTAKARLIGISVTDNYQLKVGQLVQEAVRILPRNLGLAIALDVGLERIERVDATSAFATIGLVSSVVNAGEQAADYLFGKAPVSQVSAPVAANLQATTSTTRTEGVEVATKAGGYGLFYLASEPILNTTGEAGEAVKSSVTRLAPKLQTLLAAKLLRLTANEGSSRLGIRASLEIVSPQPRVVMQRETWRAASPRHLLALTEQKTAREVMRRGEEGSLPTIPIGSRIQYRLENYSDRPIYFMVMGLDNRGSAIALYHSQASPVTEESQNNSPLKNAIAPGETLTLPHSPEMSNWVVPGPAGVVEIQLICSRVPFTKGQIALAAAWRPKGEGEYIEDLFNSLEVARAVLQDLHDASAVAMDVIGTATDSYALDVNAWATLSFIYQVV